MGIYWGKYIIIISMNLKKLFDYSVPLVAASTILVVGGIVVSLYAGKVVTDIKLAEDTVEVTGSAKESVVADQGRWTISLETHTGTNNQQDGFNRLDSAVTKIIEYLKKEGFTEYETPTGNSYPTFTYPQYGEPIQTGYSVSRTIMVRSSDVAKLSALANNVSPLMGAEYTVSTGMLELTYSKLPEMRVQLLSKAIKDAEERAKAIAQDSGRNVQTLRNASSGVVQVLAEGAIEVSDYGAYDTQSLNKEVMVTVRATFSLK
jgi:uncharacterized protein